MFKLYFVNINGNSRNKILSSISESSFNNLIFSRSSLCDIQNEHYEIDNRYFNKIQREGIKSTTSAIKKIVETGILIWRVGSSTVPMVPIQVERFLLENSETKEFFDTSERLEVLDTIKLENAFVSRGLYVEKGNLIYPNSPYYETEISSSVSSTVPFLDNSRQIRTIAPKNIIELKSAVFGGFNSNYYHFTWEIAPRLISFYEKGEKGNFPIILNRQVPNSLIELAKEISGFEPVLLGDDQKAYVDKLYLVYDGRYATQVDYTTSSTSNIFASRVQDLSRIRQLPSGKVFNPAAYDFRKIFVGRPELDHRVPSNLDKVKENLSANSFQEIAPESISLKEQISLFRDAEEICIITGAAVTNLVYCQRLKKLVILVIDQSPAFLVFWHQYCEFLGLNATFIYSQNSRKKFGPVDIEELNAVLH